MKTIRWGIIGCGDVTEVKSGPGFQESAGFAACRGHAEEWNAGRRLRAAPRRCALARRCRRDHSRRRHRRRVRRDSAGYALRLRALRCAARGKPVLVEKPMALDADQCGEMLAACRSAGVPLWVAYYRRALPRFLKVRDLVQGGAIGPVRMVTSRQFLPHRSQAEANPGSPPWPYRRGALRWRSLRRHGEPHAGLSRFRVRADRGQ